MTKAGLRKGITALVMTMDGNPDRSAGYEVSEAVSQTPKTPKPTV